MAHVEKRGPGRWRARYVAPDGRERSRTFPRKIDAERWLAGVEVSKVRGDWTDPRLARITVADWSMQWLDGLAHLTPSTRSSGLSASTVRQTYRVLSLMLNLAVRARRLSRNPGGRDPAAASAGQGQAVPHARPGACPRRRGRRVPTARPRPGLLRAAVRRGRCAAGPLAGSAPRPDRRVRVADRGPRTARVRHTKVA